MSKLKKRRIDLGLSQYQVEMLTGIRQSRLSLVERGFRKLNDLEKRKVAKILQRDEDEIFG